MRRHGLTLLEVLVSATLLGGLTSLALSLLAQAHLAVGEGAARTSLGNSARGEERLLRRELRNVIASSVKLEQVCPGTGAFTALRYRQSQGFDAETGELVEGPLRLLRFRLDSGEAWDAELPVDDDGDGLVDEGELVLFEDQDGDGVIGDSEERAVLARRVAGSDFGISVASGGDAVDATDRALFVRYALQLRLGREERGVLEHALAIALRN